jgi:hypothetical protein
VAEAEAEVEVGQAVVAEPVAQAVQVAEVAEALGDRAS